MRFKLYNCVFLVYRHMAASHDPILGWKIVCEIGVTTCAAAGQLRNVARVPRAHIKSPQCWIAEEPRLVVDELDAMRIEAAVIRLPSTEKDYCVAHYVRRLPAEITLRQLRIRAALATFETDLFAKLISLLQPTRGKS